MCGIAGALSLRRRPAEEVAAELARMAEAIKHRGPDDQGVWYDTDAGVGFSHRRLAIIDLSPLGHQPMTSASGRYTITYNGEIYNYQAVRKELLANGISFKGSSDTEVLLSAIERWGLLGALTRSDGMFAFGLWDREQRVLSLVRDRFGEKPLYYGQFKDALVFGSELQALRQHSAWAVDVDRNALALLMRYDCIPAPHSIFRQVRKVPPGAVINVRIRESGFVVEEHPFWQSKKIIEEANRHSFPGSANDAVEQVKSALEQAVQRRMVADVPLGAFLSGGIDSSLVVALMQRSSSRAVKTFSIGFSEAQFNEAPFAKAVAGHLGTDHTELMVTPRETLEVIPHLARMYDEPFADSSQIPTYLVSSLARRHVTVSLSGDGGDELFGGYSRYADTLTRWQNLRGLSGGMRAAVGRLLLSMPQWALNAATAPASFSKRWRARHSFGDYLREHASRWGSSTLPELYKSLLSLCQRPNDVVLGAYEPKTVVDLRGEWPEGAGALQLMMFLDTCLYLPDDVLVKVDRAAMAVALETRVPLLEPNVAKTAWGIPTAIHFRDGRGKWVLRQLLEQYVPKPLFDRPKMGFGVPVAQWLRTELKSWASDLLDSNRLQRSGFLNAPLVQRRWQQHLAGTMDWSFHLWGILMFQAWLEEWGPA
jgi:asparagine synthase (glutamine-hydrolysing)